MRHLRFAAGILVACALLASSVVLARPLIKMLDATLLGYWLTDQYIQTKTTEDWSTAERLRPNLNFHWARPDRSGAVRIAHALGAWRSDRDRNTLMALHQSLAQGFLLAEVDLAMGRDGTLYCFHGADGRDVLVPRSKIEQICTLDDLIGELRASPVVLILDLKSEFKQSSAIIAASVPPDLRPRIVFQLYQPADIATFNALPAEFAGPIITLYRTLRTVNHLDPELSRIGARVITVPFARVQEFGTWGSRSDRILLTHPVEDCAAVFEIQNKRFSGGYMDSDFSCSIVQSHRQRG